MDMDKDVMHVDADLHLHGRFSIGVSKLMTLRRMAHGALQKGIGLVGTGDCLHPTWLSEIKATRASPDVTIIDDSVFELGGIRFVLTAEVEDSHRVHHLFIFPSISAVEAMAEAIRPDCAGRGLASDGRPRVRLEAHQLAQRAMDAGALFGPAHAFTPWTSMYAAYGSLSDCYKDLAPNVSFIELGLSADTDMADRIPELRPLTFLSNSDAHSPVPLRLAREFTRFEIRKSGGGGAGDGGGAAGVTYNELAKAIRREGGRKPVLNAGLPPQLGKYHESACIRCKTHYGPEQAAVMSWRCTCKGRIKKGVVDRIHELSDGPGPTHPGHRPPYLYLISLAEMIAMAKGRGVNTKGVTSAWEGLVEAFGNEIRVLLDVPLEDVARKVADPKIVEVLKAFREDRIVIKAGGGGEYGSISMPQ